MRINSMQSIKINRFKVVIGLIMLIIFSLIAYAFYLYQHINDLEATDYQVTEQRLNQELSLETIEDISRFHGSNYFHVAEAQTTDQEAIIVFVNQEDPTEDLMIFSKEELYSTADILTTWEDETLYQKIYQTQYGIRHDIPLIEIIYLDQNERLSYDYYRLDNGEYDNGISFANK